MSEQVFVAREQELADLWLYLERALASQGQVCFVTGEAGSGKTALVTEFARRAQNTHNDLLVAIGQSDALAGFGAPYLPFREVLSQLTGDVEASLAQGVISAENASRLRKLASVSAGVLIEVAPDLIGLFVPGAKIVGNLGKALAKKAGWLDNLEELRKRPQLGEEPELDKSQVFEQYAKVLKALAEKQALILVLDDLHWADAGSIDLLFRLGRRLEGSPILIVGTYRPEEVALGRAGERHPLEKVVAEFKRYFGKVHVDLDRARDAEGQHFVDSLLSTEPNLLSEEFRLGLFEHTRGHPLFTIELLRDMQERGVLIQDEQGRWVVGPELEWETLPARVEGVIEERVGRLEEKLREILSVASVEGEVFTALVVARVQEMGERRLLHDLSQELEKRHRLVQEQEEVPVGRRRLSRYRFAHTLFQQYVYNGLGDGERRLLHIEIGEVLGALYGDQADEIAVQLAHHFTEGESWEQAVHYQTRAGRQALDLFETDIARRYLEMAERIAESQLGGQVDVQDKLACLEGLGDIYRTLGDYDEAMRCYEGALDLVAEDSCQTARICWKLAIVFERQSRYDDALPWLDLGLEALADTDNADLLSRLYLQYGLISARQGDLGKAFEWANKALVSESSQAHNLLAVVHRARGDLQQAASHLEKSIALGEANRDLTNLLKAYSNQGVLLFAMDNWTAAGYAYERATKLSADLDDAYMEALIQCNLSDVRRHLGDLAEATRYAAESLQKFEELENNFGKAQAHLNWGAALLMAGQPKEARTEHLELARKLLISTDSKELLSEVERWLAEAYLREGQLVKAESAARQAMAIANDQEALSDLGGAQRVLGCVHQAKGEYQRSRQLLESSQELLGQHGPRYELALTQLALAKVYQADPRCTPEAAHTLERARAAFLELGARLDMEKASALDLSLEKPSTGESGA